MLSMSLSLAKDSFFDRSRVMRAVERGRRKALSRYGAYVRKIAQNSMKRRKGSAPPGSPPYVHVGLLKRHIYFTYDAANQSVVIGPILIKAGSIVPSLLEYGGTVGKKVYEARPYMRPAHRNGLTKLRDFIKDFVTGG
jgi:hypothetical protein